MNPAAWDIICEFVLSSSLTLPNVESCLQALLGPHYVDHDWWPAIDAVFSAEDNVELMIQEVEQLATAMVNMSHIKLHIWCAKNNLPPQITMIEQDLLSIIEELYKNSNRIQ